MKPESAKGTKPNRLINETSTYLLQHAYNPVDWYAWGEEALSRAKAENKPILLSIGYAACHWCHVMEHESFEDENIAKLMNKSFINIKVDREERTDLDEIYMKAVQMMTGHGGWPMTVFLTPELKPFFGGTYFPPADRHGLPSFRKVLVALAQAWEEQPEDIAKSSDELTNHMRLMDEIGKPDVEPELNMNLLEIGTDKLTRIFDHIWGGFGNAPKFPHTFSLSLCMRYAAPNSAGRSTRKEECVEVYTTSLDKMAYGGIHDQIGGGFARYSVDRQWLIPHFEKMLYDNALLCKTYLEGFQLTGRTYWAEVARGILEFVLRELTTEDGGFYSSLDADSEGEEGKFYVWDQDEVRTVLGADADWFSEVFGVTLGGNFEHGKSALHFVKSPEDTAEKHGMSQVELWEKVRKLSAKMLLEREKRVRPGRDEKVLTSWNSLMISAFIEGYRVLRDKKYLQAALNATNFIFNNLVKDGRLLRTWGAGKAKLNAYLDDYSYFIQALLDLAEVDANPKWLNEANRLTEVLIRDFWDTTDGGLFYTSSDHEQLLTRPKSHYDGAIPSGSSVAAFVLLRLARLTGNKAFEERATDLLKMYAPLMIRVPDQFSNFLCAVDLYLSKEIEIACIFAQSADNSEDPLLLNVFKQYIPNKVVLCGSENGELKSPLLQDRGLINGQAAVYVCQNYTCDAPITDPEKLDDRLKLVAARI
ncbi:MAG TPA: thioredoxin domain-containing protein [Drouetiella sp.]